MASGRSDWGGTPRRRFLKGVGAALGAASLSLDPREMVGTPPRVPLPDQVQSAYPELNERAAGWLQFLWDRTTTEDDWSRWGVPHPWWDRYSGPGVTSYPRFDLQYSAYGVLLLADHTWERPPDLQLLLTDVGHHVNDH